MDRGRGRFGTSQVVSQGTEDPGTVEPGPFSRVGAARRGYTSYRVDWRLERQKGEMGLAMFHYSTIQSLAAG